MYQEYQNYVNRFSYEPDRWPPDMGLAELHSRCSEPGPLNPDGVQCPCCDQVSKLKIKSWARRSIQKDFSEHGAVYAYFFLLKYYTVFIALVLLINSVYPLYAIYYVCGNQILNPVGLLCLKSGIFQYLQYNIMISTLTLSNHYTMVTILQTLQAIVFYLLLFANVASIFFISYMEQEERKKYPPRVSGNILLLHSFKQQFIPKIREYLTSDKAVKIIRVIPVFEIKNYSQIFQERNKSFYKLMSLYVSCEDPLKNKRRNKKLKALFVKMNEESQKLSAYTQRVIVAFQTEEMANKVHQQYKFPQWAKWWNGVKALSKNAGLIKEVSKLPILSIRVPQATKIIWQNMGEELGNKMATKIKSLFVSLVFIVVCYLLLYYPIKFSLGARTANADAADLTFLEKIIPLLTSIIMVTLSVAFRIYMQILAEHRNPKDQMEKGKFVLLTSVSFHFIFYLIVPTIFFTYGGGINKTIKLYVVSEQARTFIIVQTLFSFVDIQYQAWKRNKNLCLSDQREGFKYSQCMLHKQVEYADYPLEIRLQTMFRIWSFALFYSFFQPYMMIYMFIAMIIIYWLQKRNIYKHYSLRKKVNITLESEFLIFYVNLFLIYQCFIYCSNAELDWKIIAAVVVTALSIFINIVYWMCFNNGQKRGQDGKQTLLEDYDGSLYESEYEKYLQSIKKPELDRQIMRYLATLPSDKLEQDSDTVKRKSVIEMSRQYIYESSDSN